MKERKNSNGRLNYVGLTGEMEKKKQNSERGKVFVVQYILIYLAWRFMYKIYEETSRQKKILRCSIKSEVSSLVNFTE